MSEVIYMSKWIPHQDRWLAPIIINENKVWFLNWDFNISWHERHAAMVKRFGKPNVQ